MPHVPKFPPRWYDFAPGDPFTGEPPLPRFLWNPTWLTPEQRAILEAETGHWATKRAEAMYSPADGFEIARQAARQMYESMKARMLSIPLPPSPTVPKPRRPRKPSRMEEELEKALAQGLPPEKEESYISTILLNLGRFRRPPTSEEKESYAKSAVAWADSEHITITEEKGMDLVNKALARFAPARS